MKLFTGKTPMSLRVNVLIAEKGIDLPTVSVAVGEGATRTPDFLERNSLGEVPVLELDDGTYLTESIAICRYLDALYPEPRLFGTDPLEAAQIEMWTRRMEQQICTPVGSFVQHTIEFFAEKVEQVPAYAESQKRLQHKRWKWLESELSDGRTYVCNDRFSIADIAGMSALFLGDVFQVPVPDELAHVKRWESAMRTRKGW